MSISRILLALLFCVALAGPVSAYAQATSYLDEAGNLHFVDSPSQVPDKYKAQLSKPKPNVMSKKQYREELAKWKKKQADEAKDKKKKDREKEKERKRLEKEMEKRDKQRPTEKGSSSSTRDSKFNSEANATPAPIVR